MMTLEGFPFVTVNTKEYHSEFYGNITRIMRRNFVQLLFLKINVNCLWNLCPNKILINLVGSRFYRLLEETENVLGLADGTKSYPVGIVRNVEVYEWKLKLLEDFYVIDMEKDPTCPLLVGRGFLATASVVIDCKKAKIAVEEGITRSMFGVKEIGPPYWTTIARRKSYDLRPSTNDICARPPYYLEKDFTDNHLPMEWEIARDAKLNPFKDVLVFRKMVEFLGAIPINFKGNMWESEDMIDKKIDWNKPLKEGDGAWYIRIEIIDLDGEKFDRVFQSIPTTRKLSEKEKPSNIIDLENFYDS
ncbi:MAK10-like protein [Tanacetum coccineum]